MVQVPFQADLLKCVLDNWCAAMSTDPLADVESCTELDLDFTGPVPDQMMSKEIHEPREVDQSLLLDVHKIAVYEITTKCPDCSRTWTRFETKGTQPELVADFYTILYDLYESFYENPRSISHLHLLQIAPGEDKRARNAAADYFAHAVDLGFDDAKNNRSKRTQQEVLEYTLPE